MTGGPQTAESRSDRDDPSAGGDIPGTQRRRGLRPDPIDGWPLDEVLVGVATVRTMRELFRQHDEAPREGPRAWDLALQCGVSAQGAANSLERLERAGLVTALAPERPWRAPGFRLKRHHPLVVPMGRLFEAERTVARRKDRRYRWRRRDRWYRRFRGRAADAGASAEQTPRIDEEDHD